MNPKEIYRNSLEIILDDFMLCTDELRIFLFLYKHSDSDLSPIFLSQKELSEKIQYSERKTGTLLHNLVEKQLVEVTERGGRSGGSGLKLSLNYPNLVKKDTNSLKEVRTLTIEKSMEKELTEEQLEILDLVKHYEMLVRRETKKNGYHAVSEKNPTTHKNWKNFVKLYVLCNTKGWDAKLYLEYAFIHVKKYWAKSQFPYANQICAKGIQNCFEIWKEKEDNKFAHNKGVKERTAIATESIEEEIDRKVHESIRIIAKSIKDYKDLDPVYAKAIIISEEFPKLSWYYLYSVDWFKDSLDGLDSFTAETKVRINQIGRDLGKHIADCVARYEEQYDLPRNLTEDEVTQIMG